MKLFIYIRSENIYYLNNILKLNYDNIGIPIQYSFDSFQGSTMISISPDEFAYLSDNNVIKQFYN
jgi:hypothetical protein